MITDTHTHLYVEEFDKDRAEVVARGLSAGITRHFLPSIDSTYTQAMIALESKYPDHIYLMMGLHPTYVKPDTVVTELNHVRGMLAKRSFKAIGEIGIDLFTSSLGTLAAVVYLSLYLLLVIFLFKKLSTRSNEFNYLLIVGTSIMLFLDIPIFRKIDYYS